MYKYPVAKPKIVGNELKYVRAAIESGWLSWLGPSVEEFEKKWAEYIGVKYAVATNSGTAALTLAMAALNIRPEDEVIVPEFTMISSALAATERFARPVFVDCGPDLNIDPELIEKRITPRTKVIMPVHIYGRMCKMDQIMDIAYRYNLQVVEDACESHGASYQGKKAGGWGDLGCFSFYSNKIITTGEGGMVTTNDERLYHQLRHINKLAFDPGHTFMHPKRGYNFVMSNLSASIGLAQLEKIDEIIAKRQQIQAWYDKKLVQYTIPRPPGSVLWMYDFIIPDKCPYNSMQFTKKLAEFGVEGRVFFKAMGLQPPFGGKWYQLEAHKYSEKGLYLPTYLDLTEQDINYISQIVVDTIEQSYSHSTN